MNSIGLAPITRLGSACITSWIAWEKKFLWDSQPHIYLGFEKRVCIMLKALCTCFHRQKATKSRLCEQLGKKRLVYDSVIFYLSPTQSFTLISYILILKQKRPRSKISSAWQCKRGSVQTNIVKIQKEGRIIEW